MPPGPRSNVAAGPRAHWASTLDGGCGGRRTAQDGESGGCRRFRVRPGGAGDLGWGAWGAQTVQDLLRRTAQDGESGGCRRFRVRPGGAGDLGWGAWGAQTVQDLPCRRCLAPEAHERKCQVFNLGGGSQPESLPATPTHAEDRCLGGAPYPCAAPTGLKARDPRDPFRDPCEKIG